MSRFLNDYDEANINIFFVASPDNNNNITGISWQRSACHPDNKYRTTIVEAYFPSELQNAQVQIKHFPTFFQNLQIVKLLNWKI